MSGTTRADVMAALLNDISGMVFASPINGANTWRTVSNRLRLWGDVSSDQQPAAFLTSHAERHEYRNLGLLRRRIECKVWCYCRSDSSPGQPMLDLMLDSFENTFCTLAIDDISRNAATLNSTVYWARIEGPVFKDPGDLDFQTLLIVPLLVEMP